MTTLACFCGGLIEGLAFLVFAAVAWVTSRIRLRRRLQPCARQCCATRSDHSQRPD